MLYEDLRVYTAWKAEETHGKEYNVVYKRTSAEWEYLGDLAVRLGKIQDAMVAYLSSLEVRFSPKVALRLLELQTRFEDKVPITEEKGARSRTISEENDDARIVQDNSMEDIKVMKDALSTVGRLLSIPGHSAAALHHVYGDVTVHPHLLTTICIITLSFTH
jgi:hypothetical protein